ncbi:hypothetical protein F7725_010275 [Dissostichus mawsoni]|uniref:DNA polymerase alpha subunit B n=1 Tax=Dissostichus mawsoni TaxID=36200 RepID=A0A7J5XPJ5_DISMA|nr:hypothetical protein F7725_010275 [Dissostichus mawsoni]
MAVVTGESLKSELEMYGIACQDDTILDKMVEQCICNRIQAYDMVLEWVAYSTTKNGLKLSTDTLEYFEHEVLNKKNKFKQSFKKEETHNRTRDIHSLQDLYPSQIKAEEEEENLLDAYSTPAKGSQKRALTTPEHPHSKRSAALLTSPGLLLSPASFSPSSTPSQKYSQRGAKGEVVVSFGAVQGTRWAGRKESGAGVQLELLEGPEDSLRSSYKYMFQRLRDVRNVLTEKIEDLGEGLKAHFNIEEFSPVSLPAQDSITVLGQVCCDSNGKLNAHSVLLEAGPEQGGQQIPVDLSELKDYSLFPGQVVVMEGMNTTGRKLMASKLYEGVPLPFLTSEVKMETNEEPLNVLVACGPYTPSDSLTFDPLLDLINIIVRDRPDVCLLLGPFVDSKHEQIEKAQVTETFEAIFSRCVESIVDGTQSVGCRLVFVPSQRDIHHHFIYPQPPFSLPSLSKDQAQDSTCKINKCLSPGNYICSCSLLSAARHPGPGPLHPADRRGTLGLTSTDILFHMGAEEISCGTGTDRFSRILKHMLTQRSYYPLYPPVEEVNMDYEKYQSFGQMPLTPDVLNVVGCVCVNPGRLTKGQVGGTYGRMLIQRSAASDDGTRASPCLAAQVEGVPPCRADPTEPQSMQRSQPHQQPKARGVQAAGGPSLVHLAWSDDSRVGSRGVDDGMGQDVGGKMEGHESNPETVFSSRAAAASGGNSPPGTARTPSEGVKGQEKDSAPTLHREAGVKYKWEVCLMCVYPNSCHVSSECYHLSQCVLGFIKLLQ